MHRFVLLVPVLVTASLLGSPGYAESSSPAGWQTSECDGWSSSHHHGEDRARACEVRRTTFSLGTNHLEVGSKNGGIEVIGEDRNDVAVEARIEAWAGSDVDANNLLRQVQIETGGDQIRDRGPESHSGRSGYGVSYRLHVPRLLGADFHTMNGGIVIEHLEGEIAFNTTNGGVVLADLAGNVHGQTVNGELQITLTGDRWKGDGLRAKTTNGGVKLSIPEHYNAHLETGTVNGGVSVDFPVTVQGTIKNHLSTNIGSGGSVVRAETTNGGIVIRSS
jgi:Putative adhesin